MRRRPNLRQLQHVQVPNQTVDDAKSLDLMQLGLLTVMLRHRDGWDIDLTDIGGRYGYGEKAMAAAMGGLQAARYVVKVRVMSQRGYWSTEVVVYDTPAADEEVAALLAAIEAEPDVRQAQVIKPTATAVNRAKKRRAKLSPATTAGRTPLGYEVPTPDQGVSNKTAGRDRVRQNRDSVANSEEETKPQVATESAFEGDSVDGGVIKKTIRKNTVEKAAAADLVPHQREGEAVENPAAAVDHVVVEQVRREVLDGLPWRVDAAMATRIAPEIAAALERGWEPGQIRFELTTNTSGLSNPVGALPTRVGSLPLNPPRKAVRNAPSAPVAPVAPVAPARDESKAAAAARIRAEISAVQAGGKAADAEVVTCLWCEHPDHPGFFEDGDGELRVCDHADEYAAN
jgi:hypothetical protein